VFAGASEAAEYRRLGKHFIFNLDEEGVRANDGPTHMQGEAAKKVHEQMQDDCRASITLVRLGSAAGHKGATGFLLRGQRRRAKFTDKWLEENGAPHGSYVKMTERAYMTMEVWDAIAPRIAASIRQSPVVQEHPEWWVILVVDGFEAHCVTYLAQKVFFENRILALKLWSHSSHLNQPFDQSPAKTSKTSLRFWLPWVRDTPGLVDTMTQWELLVTALRTEAAITPAHWQSAFISCNLHPGHKLSIEDWLEKRKEHVVASGAFTQSAADIPIKCLIRIPKFWMKTSLTKGDNKSAPCVGLPVPGVRTPLWLSRSLGYVRSRSKLFGNSSTKRGRHVSRKRKLRTLH
jgi:hypothetical protein